MYHPFILFTIMHMALGLVTYLSARLLGFDHWLFLHDWSMGEFISVALGFGVTGGVLALIFSKPLVKYFYHIKILSNPGYGRQRWLVDRVEELAMQAGIEAPDVGIFKSAEINALAAGYSKHHALIAISSTMLETFDPDELDAVLGHEIAHITNGDMQTHALLHGGLNTYMLFLPHLVGRLVDRFFLRTPAYHGMTYRFIHILFMLGVSNLAILLVSWFSRQREFRADARAAHLVGPEKVIAALRSLYLDTYPHTNVTQSWYQPLIDFLIQPFMTHPSLQERIAALRTMQ